MDNAGFLFFILLALTVTIMSYAFDRLYARIIPFRVIYHAIRFPGVVLHELSHVLGCIVTGAEVIKVVLFSEGGGSVAHGEPKVPFIGTVIISTAPLLILPLFLTVMSWIFSSLFGVALPSVIPNAPGTNYPSLMIDLTASIFTDNLFLRFNAWFLVYLYFVTSIILSLGPSLQDLKNAGAGIAAIVIVFLIVIWSGHAGAAFVLDRILQPISYAFLIGILFEMIVATASLPLIMAYWIKSTG